MGTKGKGFKQKKVEKEVVMVGVGVDVVVVVVVDDVVDDDFVAGFSWWSSCHGLHEDG